MLIKVDKLKRTPRQVALVEPADDFPHLKAMTANGEVAFTRNICGTLEAVRADDIIEVSGRLQTAVTLTCSRCLADVSCDLDVDVALCYSDATVEEGSDTEEREVGFEELGLIAYTGDEIDLRPDVEQEIIMALPQQPLCKDGCLGLCPVCGHNRNQGECQCSPPVFHAELAKLKNFKLDKN